MSKGNNSQTRKFLLFSMLATMFAGKGLDEKTSNKRAFHQSFLNGGNPEFSPQKHIVMGYAQQNRLAKKRRKMKARMPK